MIEDPTPTLVLGEAPESDEEEIFEKNKVLNVIGGTRTPISSVHGLAIAGEAIESDEEIEVHNIENRTFPAQERRSVENERQKQKIDKKYKTSSIKKLCEKNKSLHENLTSFKKQMLHSTNNEMNNINQQLLRSQIELQQTLVDIRNVKINLNEVNKKLSNIMAANYIPKINIKVPSYII
ncbi:uncharacterized protein LOC135846357 [Planococcus citri]|uniref:uncharacterized protein LOC135846357 n=1 Tax=Planococcus citri TaxID=170843 RepID=UPI0031F9C8CA